MPWRCGVGQYRSHAAELGDKVTFVGYATDVKTLLQQIDVLVHFTRGGEGFGRVVAEAMAAGCVPLVRKMGALPELVDSGRSGIVADSPQELTSWIVRLCNEAELRAQLSAGAHQRAQAFREREIAGAVMTFYDQVFESIRDQRTR